MNIKPLLLTFMLGISMSASADLIYDEGTAPSHGPSGEEVTIEDPSQTDAATQVSPDDAVIESPEEFDANDVDDDEIEQEQEDEFESEVTP